MTVNDQIINILNDLCKKFGMAIDWAGENVIPYVTTLCQKLISYEIWTSAVWIGLMVTLSIVAIIISVRLRVFSQEFFDNFELTSIILGCVFVMLWISTIFVIGVQILDIVKCVTFPEMYVFEYISNLINGASQGG